MVYRQDNFEIQNFNKTSNGFLNISGIVTRTGVFKYSDGGELRPANEVLKLDSLESMFAIPVTFEHPPDLLNENTVQIYQKGFVASKPIVEKQKNIDLIKIPNIIIQDKNLIEKIEGKKINQFSLGYSCDLDETVGEFDGEGYVRIQKNIVYNHLAIVKEARCGEICSITKEDSMAKKEFKADCACQSEKRTDEVPEELKKEKKELEEEKKEKDLNGKDPKKDEEEKEPSWTKKMFEQHGKMLDALEKILFMQTKGKDKIKEEKEEDEAEGKDKDEDEEDLYDSESDEPEEKTKKDKRKDSVKETISSFKFETKSGERKDSSEFKKYDRNEYINSCLNKGAK
jgi:hypothetical protein